MTEPTEHSLREADELAEQTGSWRRALALHLDETRVSEEDAGLANMYVAMLTTGEPLVLHAHHAGEIARLLRRHIIREPEPVDPLVEWCRERMGNPAPDFAAALRENFNVTPKDESHD